MIIQCEQCQTKFRLDDSKVTDKGVKVRCAKCRHVFSVARQQPEPEAGEDFGALLDQAAGSREEAVDQFYPQEDDTAPDEVPAPEAAVDSWDEMFAEKPLAADEAFNMFDTDSSRAAGEETALPSFETAAGFGLEQPEAEPEAETASVATSEDFGGFAFDAGNPFADADPSLVVETVPPEAGSTATVGADFAGFAFDDASPFAEAAPEAAPEAEAVQPPAGDPDFAGFDFNGDDLFAATSETEEPAVPEGSGILSGTAAEETEIVANNTMFASGEGFSLGEIPADTADEDADVLTNARVFTALAVEQKPLDTDAAEPAPGIETMAGKGAMPEEMPPLSISSRRQRSSFVSGAIAVAGVLAAAVIAFFGYSSFMEDKSKVVQEAERISVRSIEASFVKNPATGDLLLIAGEAVNNFKKPRAAIQIKGMVYGADGQIVASKNAYAGNPLTKEQLTTMPLDKIEAAMSNQFGDSLANLEVAPGKAIPFVIVIAQPPADAKDYGVEPVGSTVATGK